MIRDRLMHRACGDRRQMTDSLSDRYHGKETMAALVSMTVTSLFRICPLPTVRRGYSSLHGGEYTRAPRTHNRSVCYLLALDG